jgi:hypothetical protein
MTVQALAQRLARWTSSKSLSQMSVEDRLILTDCINSGIYNWYAYAPERLRMTTVSHMIRPPETGTVDSVVEGANELIGLSLQDYHLGASIDFGGKNMNEIVSTSGTPTVLNQHRGTETNVGYTIYFDTIMITDYLVSRIVSNPRILDTGLELYRDDERMRFSGAERRGTDSWWGNQGVVRDFGEPFRYVYENTGLSLGDEARAMIRMDPIPLTQMDVVFDAVVDAPTYNMTDMEGVVNLAVPDQYVLPHLLPLAIGDLATSPIWGEADPTPALQKSDAVISKISDELKLNNGAPHNYVRTRPGY